MKDSLSVRNGLINAEDAVQELNGSASEKELALKLIIEAAALVSESPRAEKPLKEEVMLLKSLLPRATTSCQDFGKSTV